MASQFKKYSEIHRAYHAQFAWRCILRLAFVSFVVGITFPCRAEDDPEGEMAKIVAAHKHWRESIVSVRFVWETVHDPHAPIVKGTKYEGVKRTATDEFIWCDDGRFRLHTTGRHDGGLMSRELRCGDGMRAYSMKYGNGPSESEKPVTVNILPAPTPGQGGGMMLVPLNGLWFSGRLYWLAELISMGSVTFNGYADVNGERTPRIKVERAPDLFTTIMLNPEKGYLPSLVEEGRFRSEIHTYRHFEPDLWFPWTGSTTSGVDSQAWEMKEIQVNSQLDPKLFQPVFAPGTVIEDVVGGKRTVHGAMSHQSDVEKRIVQNAQNNLVVAGEPATAYPPTSGAMPWIVITSLVSLGFAVTALFLRRRT